ncbi:MAG: relaxase/mobilization nuclease domain-containing protein, partial [Pseudomonadota bacterium]
MVPSVAQRGSSFKGAGAYYLHDKGKDTSERVAWAVTHNVPTQDANKALKWMAYTATHADTIKRENGTSTAGAKSQGKPVYAYSLAWHHTDKPSREEMEAAAFSSLDKLGLQDHEAVIVCHQDQKHPHIHVITNLVNPQTGRTQAPKMDYNRLSQWAQQHDLEHGRDHCPLRRENNQRRYQDKAKSQFVKHNAKRHERAAMFQAMADRAKTGGEFRDQLEVAGYTLAQGHKGRLVIVDDRGEVSSLTRQLKHPDGKGYRAKDLRTKLKGVDFKELPKANMLRDIRRGVDRDGYAAEQDDKLFAAALKADRAKEKAEKEQARREEQSERDQMREDSAKARQKQRHKTAAKHRTAFRNGGRVGAEFNAEVEDIGRKADQRAIERELKRKEDSRTRVSSENSTFNQGAQNREEMDENTSGQSSNFNQKAVQSNPKDQSKQEGREDGDGSSKRRRIKRHREARKHREQHGTHESVTSREFNEEVRDEATTWSKASPIDKASSDSKRSRVKARRKEQSKDKLIATPPPQQEQRSGPEKK